MDLNEISDMDILALTIYGEARGEPIEGQIAVASVIRNRAAAWHRTYREICLAPEQFSCWNTNDPNYPLLISLSRQLANDIDLTDAVLKQCLAVADIVYNNDSMDNTHGSLNYITKALQLSDKCPSWAKDFKIQIGSQVFGTA